MQSNPTENASVDVDALVREAQAGSDVAFDKLVREFAKPMYNLAYRMMGNPHDARDLTQEIFVKLHRSIGKFRWRSKFSTWLYALASNMCRSGLRKVRRISDREVVHLDSRSEDSPGPPEPADPTDGPDRAAARAELRAQVEAAITALPEDARIIVTLRDLQGLAYEEIADTLQCSVGTVKSRLSRARTRVKDSLIRQGILCTALR